MAPVVVAVERDVEVEGRGNLRVHLHEFCESSSNASRSAGGLPLLVLCVHGAGYSGRTFAPLAEALLGRLAASTADGGSTTTGTASEAADERAPGWIEAPDLRAHGATTADDEADLSIETLVKDLERLYETSLSGRFGDVVLVGWSLGAAIATKAAATGGLLGSRVVGLVAIDVVEGTAMDALKSMSMILAARPKGFDSIDEAVEWALSSGAVRRRASAENSVPGMLVERDGGRCGGGVTATMGGNSASSRRRRRRRNNGWVRRRRYRGTPEAFDRTLWERSASSASSASSAPNSAGCQRRARTTRTTRTPAPDDTSIPGAWRSRGPSRFGRDGSWD